MSNEDINGMVETIYELERELEKYKWIPCSERLPEKDDRYLTTYPLIRDMKWVHILWYGEPSMPSREVQGKVWYVSDEEYGDVPYDDVIAWMPLPKPYKEDDK